MCYSFFRPKSLNFINFEPMSDTSRDSVVSIKAIRDVFGSKSIPEFFSLVIIIFLA